MTVRTVAVRVSIFGPFGWGSSLPTQLSFRSHYLLSGYCSKVFSDCPTILYCLSASNRTLLSSPALPTLRKFNCTAHIADCLHAAWSPARVPYPAGFKGVKRSLWRSDCALHDRAHHRCRCGYYCDPYGTTLTVVEAEYETYIISGFGMGFVRSSTHIRSIIYMNTKSVCGFVGTAA